MKKRIFSLALASTMVLGTFGTVMAADEVLVNKPFVDGYPGGTFKPDNSVSRAEVTKLVSVAYDYATQNASFSDTQNHWANKYIGALTGVVKGYPDGTFKPDNTMTRAEFATIMSRVNDKNIAATNKSFADIGNHWAEDDIKRMASAGVVEGYEDGTFRPDQPVTRAEAVAMILRNEGIKPDLDIASKVTNPFTDVTSEAWYIEEVLTAAGIYKYTQDADGNRKVVANTDVEDIDGLKVVNKVITGESEDLLVEIAGEDGMPLDYASFNASGYHIIKEKVVIKDSKGNNADDVIRWEVTGMSESGKPESVPVLVPENKPESVPVLVPENMELDEKYTVEFPIAKQGEYYATAKGTVQLVKAANAKVSSIDGMKLVSDCGVEMTSGKMVGGFLNGAIDEVFTIERINATVNGGTMNLLDSSIAEDVKVKSSNSSIVEVIKDNDGVITLNARATGKATITVTYGDLTFSQEIEVIKEERKIREIKANVSEIKLLTEVSQGNIVISLFDQYGDPAGLECIESEETLEAYIKENITGSAVVSIDDIDTSVGARNQIGLTVTGEAPGTGFIYVNLADEDYKNEVNIFKIPVDVTSIATLGEKKVVIEDQADDDYSDDFELDLNKDNLVIFNISQFTKEGHFSGKVADLEFEVDNPEIIDVIAGADDNFEVEGLKKGKAQITLRDQDGNTVAKVDITVVDSSKTDEITAVNYRVDANTTITGAPLNAIKDYNIGDFISQDAIKTNVVSLSKPEIVDGEILVDGDVVGTLKVELYEYDEDGNTTKTVLDSLNLNLDNLDGAGNPDPINDFIVALADKDGERKAKVSVEVISNNGTEYDKVYELDLAK